ncbi:hypothetical protein BG006_002504, partial [Podila minutissima]
MTDNHITLFCLVNGEATPFSVEVDPSKTVDHLKKAIKAEKTNVLGDFDADELTLWHVSIPDDDDIPIPLDSVPEKKKLKATTKLSKVFIGELPEDTIHVIVQRPQSGDLRVDIKKIADKFFATGSKHADFLDNY